MFSTVLASAPNGIPADCKPPVFPWESQYTSCFKAGYETGAHANLGQVANAGMFAGHGPGPVVLLLIVIVLAAIMFRRSRSGSPATR